MRRDQEVRIRKDLAKKMVFIVGPRQVGKTWLAKEIGKSFEHTVYLNYDRFEDRQIIGDEAWLDHTELLILDELHKMAGWKNYLKGVFDTRRPGLRILVTGSARLDAFRQAGDALTGRYFAHRLLPFSPSELKGTELEGALDRLMRRGGFPEPLLADEEVDADRWRLQYVDGLIRTDILDFERIHDLRAMQLVLQLLQRGVGSPVSTASIARDVGVAPNTVKKYIQVLEALFIVFRVTPHSRNVARSILKEPKIYFFDTGLVKDDPGTRFENMVAVCLFKHAMGMTDSQGKAHALHYLRTKEGKEVDFCLLRQGNPVLLAEAKLSGSTLIPQLALFSERLRVPAVQLVRHLKRERKEAGIEIRNALTFLASLPAA